MLFLDLSIITFFLKACTKMAVTLRSLLYNRVAETAVHRALSYTSSKHVINSNSNTKEIDENVMKNWKVELHNTMKILPDFINEKEEGTLVKEIDPYMKQLRYEFSHWDDVSKLLIICLQK
jgi:hypothetical protein